MRGRLEGRIMGDKGRGKVLIESEWKLEGEEMVAWWLA